MAFMRYARAAVVKPQVSGRRWGRIRTAATHVGPPDNLVTQASEILDENFDPQKYLLTHATIVCSVDVEEVSNVKLGSRLDNYGRKINIRWADYRIKPDCDQFINNNNDAWARDVLLKSYRTFIGSHNFVEHVQIEEQSKGRIIDAVARDIGPSVYIDILIATNRKHASLVKDIESGKMSTLSMGCSVTETICTKCGNVAADETEMCPHIRYEKGNYFYDDQGNRHRIAELCGHNDIDPHGGVQFIEASWVGTPAFGGAVMRNILTPNQAVHERAAKVLSEPPAAWQEGLPRAARIVQVPAQVMDEDVGILAENELDFGSPDEDTEAPEAPAPEQNGPPGAKDDKDDKGDKLKTLEDDMYQMMLDRVKKRYRDESAGPESAPSEPANSAGEDIIKQATRRFAYQAGIEGVLKAATSEPALIDSVARFNRQMEINVPRALYLTTLKVGATSRYRTPHEYLAVCQRVLGHSPSHGEAKTLIRLGKLLSMWNELHATNR